MDLSSEINLEPQKTKSFLPTKERLREFKAVLYPVVPDKAPFPGPCRLMPCRSITQRPREPLSLASAVEWVAILPGMLCRWDWPPFRL